MDPKTRSVGKGFWIRIALLQLVVVVAVTIGALISLTKCDLHEFQRWGAVVAGLGALYVFLQYGYDITLERLRGRLSDEESGKELGFLGPVARRLERLPSASPAKPPDASTRAIAPGSNPLFHDKFTADPAPLVVGDRLFTTGVAGRLQMLDGRSMEWNEMRVRRDPACTVCGARSS